MSDLISRQALCEYALNQKDKSITPNDIMRFPSAQPEVTEEAVKDYCRKRHLTILTNDYFHKLISAQPEWHDCDSTDKSTLPEPYKKEITK